MEISVIICSYNREQYILNALQSMVDQTYAATNFEVIVADNNSTDNTPKWVNTFIQNNISHQIIYLNENQQGASYARNTGAAIAKGKLLVFMDDDAVANPNFLEEIIKFNIANPTIQGFGGRIIPLYMGGSEPNWMSHYTSSLVGNFNYSNQVIEFAANRYPLESNMVVTANAFNQINGFNKNLPGVQGTLRIGGEGKDFFMRLKANGYAIYYVPTIIVEHVVEVSKLTRAYMYRVASGVGRGERERIRTGGSLGFAKKLIEYIFKYFASIAIGLYYIAKGQPNKCLALIQFRYDALKGFLGY